MSQIADDKNTSKTNDGAYKEKYQEVLEKYYEVKTKYSDVINRFYQDNLAAFKKNNINECFEPPNDSLTFEQLVLAESEYDRLLSATEDDFYEYLKTLYGFEQTEIPDKTDRRRDLDYDEDKQQYYDVNTGEYLSEQEFEEYWNEIQMIMNGIGELDKEEALKLLEASNVEYEIFEPGQCVDVEIGHEYKGIE